MIVLEKEREQVTNRTQLLYVTLNPHDPAFSNFQVTH